MADQLPLNFQPAPKPIASFLSSELAEGFEYVPYFISAQTDSSGTTYRIGTDVNYSSEIVIPYGGTATTTATCFSGIFQRAREVKGIVRFNFCAGVIGGNPTIMGYQVKFYHYRPTGTVSTQLGSTWTSAGQTSAGAAEIHRYNGSITVPQTHFAIGDQIKIEVLMNYSGGGGVINSEIGIDPQNRDSIHATPVLVPSVNPEDFTIFAVRVPYKVDA